MRLLHSLPWLSRSSCHLLRTGRGTVTHCRVGLSYFCSQEFLPRDNLAHRAFVKRSALLVTVGINVTTNFRVAIKMGDSNYSIQNYVSSRPTHRSAPQATATRSFVFKLFHRCLYLVSDTQTSFLMLRKRYVCIKETDTLRCRPRRHSCDISGHFKTRGWVTSLCLHFFFLKVPLVSIHLGNTLPRKLLSPLQDESTDCEESTHSRSLCPCLFMDPAGKPVH